MRAWLAIGIACLLWLPGVADVLAPVRFSPDSTAPTAARLRGNTWAFEGPGYAVDVQQIDEAERRAFIHKTTGWDVDPYASPSDQPARFLTFLVRIENRSEGGIHFQPPGCWLVTDRREILHPLGLDALRAEYRMVALELAPAYDRAGPAILEHGSSVAPGQSVAGLLVYHRFKPRTRGFRLELPIMLADGQSVRLAAPYQREKHRKRGG